MLLQVVCSIICKKNGQVVKGACTVLLLFAASTSSYATTLCSSGQDIVMTSSETASLAASDEDEANCAHEAAANQTIMASTPDPDGTITVPSSEASVGNTTLLTAAAENRIPDWNGIWRDTATVFVGQTVVAGVLYILPENISKWSNDQKNSGITKYGNNFIDPVIDNDEFYINYILHPYWGATYYTRGRERGLNKVYSFAYSALMSAMYEFGVECIYEKPSIQDLIVTPVVGSLLGAYIFEPWRESIKSKQDLRWYDHVVLIATDPIGVLSLGVEKLFGIKSTIIVDYSVPQLQKSSTESATTPKSSRIGVALQFPFN